MSLWYRALGLLHACDTASRRRTLHLSDHQKAPQKRVGDTDCAAVFVRAWPRARAEAVFFLPNHLPGVDAAEDDVEQALSRDGASCV